MPVLPRFPGFSRVSFAPPSRRAPRPVAYRRRRAVALLALCTVGLLGAAGASLAGAEGRVLRVGVTSGPHEEIFEAAKRVAERDYGLRIQVVPFSDYIAPDAALDAGDLDANSYQHRPFLNAQIRARGYHLVGVGRTWIGPIGLYSRKYRSFGALPEHATIGIPNDPANESRTLLLLQKAGAIRLRSGIDPVAGVNATPRDITANPKGFRFTEIDAAQLPRTLDDFDATTVNADYAIKAGLQPGRDTILVEDGSTVYACLIAVRDKDAGQPWVRQLVAAYESPEVRQFILSRYHGAIIPAF
ncbi:MetQ/NlpA family ABC transporter substrate-binding protein [Burkholderia plantarii]|uniref:MetQ/NlpA family ABC transporter substrate-binding protein n=1 Tax=Burkholderia plantarii TaxID=41899 RepID=UPI0027297974|nr:MetQ/NlpA family ABC transporter substrate-binding protein [Burkholderia plantarii]WLE62886.1 MetQ/NlpA family ABC transporter substrate-binding protein [Burkholderia plantarii]